MLLSHILDQVFGGKPLLCRCCNYTLKKTPFPLTKGRWGNLFRKQSFFVHFEHKLDCSTDVALHKSNMYTCPRLVATITIIHCKNFYYDPTPFFGETFLH